MKHICNYYTWILVCSIISVAFSFDESGEVISTLYKTQISRVDKGVKRPVRFCQGFEDPAEIDCYIRSDIKTYVCTEPVAFNPCESLQRVETFHYDHIIHRCVKVNVPACEGQLIRVMTLLQCLVYCHNKDPFSLGKSRSMVYKLNQAKPYVPREKIEDEREKIMNNAQKKSEKNAANRIEETKKDQINDDVVVHVIKTVDVNEKSKTESGKDHLKKKSNSNGLENTMSTTNDVQTKSSIPKKAGEAVKVASIKTLKTEEAPISSDKKASETPVDKNDVKENVLKPSIKIDEAELVHKKEMEKNSSDSDLNRIETIEVDQLKQVNIKNDGLEILDNKEGQTTITSAMKDTKEVAKSHAAAQVSIPDIPTLVKEETNKISLRTVLPIPAIKNPDNSAENEIPNEEIYAKTLNGNADLAEYLLGVDHRLVKKSVPDDTQVNVNDDVKNEKKILEENKTTEETEKKNINSIKIETAKTRENDKREISAIKEMESVGKKETEKAKIVKAVEKNKITPENAINTEDSEVNKIAVIQKKGKGNAEDVNAEEEKNITPVEKSKKEESEVKKSEVVDKKENAEIVKDVVEKNITHVEKTKKDEHDEETPVEKKTDPIELDKKETVDTNEIEAIEIKEAGNDNSKSKESIDTKLLATTNKIIKSDSTDQSKDDGFYLWDE